MRIKAVVERHTSARHEIKPSSHRDVPEWFEKRTWAPLSERTPMFTRVEREGVFEARRYATALTRSLSPSPHWGMTSARFIGLHRQTYRLKNYAFPFLTFCAAKKVRCRSDIRQLDGRRVKIVTRRKTQARPLACATPLRFPSSTASRHRQAVRLRDDPPSSCASPSSAHVHRAGSAPRRVAWHHPGHEWRHVACRSDAHTP